MSILITSDLKKIPDFPVGTTMPITLQITLNGAYPNITADIIRMIWKENMDDTDAFAILTKDADVITDGATGKAYFSIAAVDTETIDPGEYYCDIQWISATAEYILVKQEIVLQERVSDV